MSVLVNQGKRAVCDLVRAVDRAFAFLGLQTFYKVSLLVPHRILLKCHNAMHASYRSIQRADAIIAGPAAPCVTRLGPERLHPDVAACY